MSMSMLNYTCSKCDFSSSDVVMWGRRSYRMGQQTVSVNAQLGWCDDCQDLAPIEVLPSPERARVLSAELANVEGDIMALNVELQTGRPWYRRALGLGPGVSRELMMLEFRRDDLVETRVEDAKRSELLADRSTPPLCLRCGSDKCRALPALRVAIDGDDADARRRLPVEHPGCGGTFIVAVSPIRVSIATVHRFYDINGRFVEEQESN
jgi:hypothetical protein